MMKKTNKVNKKKVKTMKPAAERNIFSKLKVPIDPVKMDIEENISDMKDDKLQLDSIMQEASQKTELYDKTQVQENKENLTTHQQQRAASSAKAFYQEFKKVVEASDVILQVLDARDPLGTRSSQVEEVIRDAGPTKRCILVLNKSDLVPLQNLKSWLTYLRHELPAVAFKSSTSKNPNFNKQRKYKIVNSNEAMLKTSPCFGVETLLNLLSNYCKNKDIKGSLTVGVIGYPNVGKSSLINSLKRERACNIGNLPGVTREIQTVRLNKHINLIDSPGLVVAPENTEEDALRNAVKVANLDDAEVVVETLFKKIPRENFAQMYGINKFRDCHAFLCMLAQRRGYIKKRGLPNANQAAKLILNDWNSGKMKFHTAPPVIKNEVSSKIVQQISDEFNIESIQKLEIEEVTAMATNTLTKYQLHQPSESMNMGTENSKSNVGEAYSVVPYEITKQEGNQQLNKQRKQQFKRMKKDLKRRDKLAAALSKSFEEALGDL